MDIILVAILIYQLYNLVKGTVAIRIFLGILTIYLLWKLVEAFKMEMLGEILGQFISLGVIALLIVFQQELRRFLLMIGNTDFLSSGKKGGLFKFLSGQEDVEETALQPIIDACSSMSKSKTGALIVLARRSDPEVFSTGGDDLDMKLSAIALKSIFFKNSPLHDGAAIIKDNRIKAARCILPISEREDIPVNYGLRHRSAMGITEHTDAIAVVVSEETGEISLVFNGKITANLNVHELGTTLKKMLGN